MRLSKQNINGNEKQDIYMLYLFCKKRKNPLKNIIKKYEKRKKLKVVDFLIMKW
jgi:hypothetical protein